MQKILWLTWLSVNFINYKLKYMGYALDNKEKVLLHW